MRATIARSGARTIARQFPPWDPMGQLLRKQHPADAMQHAVEGPIP